MHGSGFTPLNLAGVHRRLCESMQSFLTAHVKTSKDQSQWWGSVSWSGPRAIQGHLLNSPHAVPGGFKHPVTGIVHEHLGLITCKGCICIGHSTAVILPSRRVDRCHLCRTLCKLSPRHGMGRDPARPRGNRGGVHARENVPWCCEVHICVDLLGYRNKQLCVICLYRLFSIVC